MTNTLHPTCLIFSTLEDTHVREILTRLSEDTVPLVVDFSMQGESFTLHAEVLEGNVLGVISTRSGTKYILDSVESVWWRRPNPFIPNTNLKESQVKYVVDERTHAWGAVLADLPESVRWYNHFTAQRVAEKKVFQIARAAKSGLVIPATVLTSSGEAAKQFSKKYDQIVYKSQWGHSGAWAPTRVCSNDVLDQFDNHSECPVILQQYVDGKFDYRVTVIDNFYSAVCFDLTETRYPYDVRIDMKNPCKQVTLPEEIVSNIRSLLLDLGLRYGAVDLRKGDDGRFYFLEVNPAGQFLYLDHMAGTSNAEAVANCLSVKSNLIRNLAPSIDISAINMNNPLNSVTVLALEGEKVTHLN